MDYIGHNRTENHSGHQSSVSRDHTPSYMMANGRFMITKSIGKGSFGEIYQGYDNVTGKEVAIKMVSIA
jgi:serine/threonine protein kinase